MVRVGTCGRFTFAPSDSSTFAAAVFPYRAAICSGVNPWLPNASVSTKASPLPLKTASTVSASPSRIATSNTSSCALAAAAHTSKLTRTRGAMLGE